MGHTWIRASRKTLRFTITVRFVFSLGRDLFQSRRLVYDVFCEDKQNARSVSVADAESGAGEFVSKNVVRD